MIKEVLIIKDFDHCATNELFPSALHYFVV